MSPRTWKLLFLVYVALDLSSPFVPGAFNFDPDDCVDGLHRLVDGRAPCRGADVRTPAVAPIQVKPAPVGDRAVRDLRLAPRQAISDWLIDLRRSHPPSRDVGSVSEDH
jgi:hypothetical protein